MFRTELPQASRVVMPGVGETAHRQLDVVQLEEVQLDVLARGDVAESARVALGDLGHASSCGTSRMPCGILIRSIDASPSCRCP